MGLAHNHNHLCNFHHVLVLEQQIHVDARRDDRVMEVTLKPGVNAIQRTRPCQSTHNQIVVGVLVKVDIPFVLHLLKDVEIARGAAIRLPDQPFLHTLGSGDLVVPDDGLGLFWWSGE